MKIIKIDQRFWLRFFRDKKFLKALRITSKITRKSGYETAFNAEIDSKKRIFITNIVQGGCADTANYETIFEFPVVTYLGISFLDFHFHPGKQGIIIPSRGDLKNLDISPFIGVGIVDDKGFVSILLVMKNYPDADIKIYWREISDGEFTIVTQQSEVIKSLKHAGCKADILIFGKLSSGLQFQNNQEKKLKFFTTKIFVPETSNEYTKLY